jgi:hypothetical protein
MKEKLDSLLVKLSKNTVKLCSLVENDDIESALDVVTRRLNILDEIQTIVSANPEFGDFVKNALSGYISAESDLTAKMLKQKDNIAEQLLKLERMNKAGQAYRSIL